MVHWQKKRTKAYDLRIRKKRRGKEKKVYWHKPKGRTYTHKLVWHAITVDIVFRRKVLYIKHGKPRRKGTLLFNKSQMYRKRPFFFPSTRQCGSSRLTVYVYILLQFSYIQNMYLYVYFINRGFVFSRISFSE